MHHVKLTRVGSGLGLTLPPETLARLGLKEGDSLVLNESPTGLVLAAMTDEDKRVMRAFEEVSAQHHETLRRLAK